MEGLYGNTFGQNPAPAGMARGAYGAAGGSVAGIYIDADGKYAYYYNPASGVVTIISSPGVGAVNTAVTKGTTAYNAIVGSIQSGSSRFGTLTDLAKARAKAVGKKAPATPTVPTAPTTTTPGAPAAPGVTEPPKPGFLASLGPWKWVILAGGVGLVATGAILLWPSKKKAKKALPAVQVA